MDELLFGWLSKFSLSLHSSFSESLWQVVTASGWFRLRQAPSPAVSLVPFHIHEMALRFTPNSSSQLCWHYNFKEKVLFISFRFASSIMLWLFKYVNTITSDQSLTVQMPLHFRLRQVCEDLGFKTASQYFSSRALCVSWEPQ